MRVVWVLAATVLLSLKSFSQDTGHGVWVGTWASAQQIPEPQNALPAEALTDMTLRETVHVSQGGSLLRIRLSNAFGTRALQLTSVHIAKPLKSGSASIDPASDRALLFNGKPEVSIPPGAEFYSDAISFPLAPLSDLTVSLHLEKDAGQQTGHPGSRETAYYVHGNLTGSAELADAVKTEHWYMLTGVDVMATAAAYSIVALGDSITDGHATTTNGNDRWPDVLAKRLQANSGTQAVGVLNVGIGGNHLLTDGLGPNVLARFDRDVLASPGVRYVIVLEGINDLGALSRTEGGTPENHQQLVQRMISAYRQIIERSHAAGIRVYGGTITPDLGSDYYHPDAASEQDRQQVNAWIRSPGHFDAVIDFDKITSDPAFPGKLLPDFDSGDHLHPGPAGYRAMGSGIPLSLFAGDAKASGAK